MAKSIMLTLAMDTARISIFKVGGAARLKKIRKTHTSHEIVNLSRKAQVIFSTDYEEDQEITLKKGCYLFADPGYVRFQKDYYDPKSSYGEKGSVHTFHAKGDGYADILLLDVE